MTIGQIVQVNPGTDFTNVYSSSGIPTGTKILIQNLTSSELFICLYATAQEQGFVIRPYEKYIVPAGALGCFVKTVRGVGGPLAIEVGAWNVLEAPVDERVYTGLKGLTVQPFTEANVKNGTQWEFSFENTSLAAGASSDAVFTTGSKYVLVKSRILTFTGSEIEASVYKGATYTGGSIVPIYNLNTTIEGLPLSAVRSGVTVTATGIEIAAKTHAYGTDTNVNQTVGSYNVAGIERVLQPNTTYLLRIVNQSAISIKIAGYITFYEGELSSLN
jgi:hypothetical protein